MGVRENVEHYRRSRPEGERTLVLCHLADLVGVATDLAPLAPLVSVRPGSDVVDPGRVIVVPLPEWSMPIVSDPTLTGPAS